jgi:VWFA-related protein
LKIQIKLARHRSDLEAPVKRHLLAVILIAQLAAGAFAQQPRPSVLEPPPPPRQITQQTEPPPQKPDAEEVVRITTNLVQVDAVVTDQRGKVVTDLKPEELQISEDGRPQKITNFSYVVTGTPAAVARPAKEANADRNAPPVPPVRLKPEDIQRTIALVVDDLGLSFVSTYYVRRALKKFVDEQMQPGDLVAIIRTGSGLGALQQFTSDKRQLYAAIERVKYNLNSRASIGVFAPIQPATEGQMGPEIDTANQELDQFREDLFTVGTLGALSYVVRGLRELPGRKSILLISDGIPLPQPGDPNRSVRAADKIKLLVDEAGRASVVIYTMNATGLQTIGINASDDVSYSGPISSRPPLIAGIIQGRSSELIARQGGLDYLADQTGGIAINNSNDLSAGIRRVLDDQKGYYLIGYRPDQSTFDPRTGRRKFHHLSLTVTRKGKFNVRMRNGFYGVTNEEPTGPRTQAQQLFRALTSPFGATGVHVQLTSLFANDANAGSFMRSMLHIDARDLTFTDESNGMHKCVFDLLAITFGDNGTAVEQNGRTYTIEMSDESYKRVLRQGLAYNVIVPIKKPGAYQLRMALRDPSTERVGSASQFIEVPDINKNRLTLSGLVLRGSGRQNGANLAAKNGNADNSEGVEQSNAESGPAVRHFGGGTLMEYGFVIYNARTVKPTNLPQLTTQVRLFRDGKLVFTGKEIPFDFTGQADLKRLVANAAIQLGTELAPGEYVFQIIVNDMLTTGKFRTATQWMDFEIIN